MVLASTLRERESRKWLLLLLFFGLNSQRKGKQEIVLASTLKERESRKKKKLASTLRERESRKWFWPQLSEREKAGTGFDQVAKQNKNKGGGGWRGETGLSLLPTENKSIKSKCLDKCQSKKKKKKKKKALDS